MKKLQNTKLPISYTIKQSLFKYDKNGNLTNDSIHKEFMRLVELRDEWEDVWHSSKNPIEKSHAHTEFLHCLKMFREFLNTFHEDILFNKK